MSNLSKLSRNNLMLSGIVLLIAFLIPIFQNNAYKGKKTGVESVVKIIIEEEKKRKDRQEGYLAIAKAEQKSLEKLAVSESEDYNYIITLNGWDGFTVVAEPKEEALKHRDVPAEIYRCQYSKTQGEEKSIITKWSGHED